MRRIVKLADDLEKPIDWKFVGELQGVEPTADLLHGLNGWSTADFTDDPLQLFVVSQRMVRTPGKKPEYHHKLAMPESIKKTLNCILFFRFPTDWCRWHSASAIVDSSPSGSGRAGGEKSFCYVMAKHFRRKDHGSTA
ncbi:MAG TPA: hypothetical protein PLF25_12470 [Accumulibacter sp.]|nr:hypothetical protein [Accumulibacter sp.]